MNIDINKIENGNYDFDMLFNLLGNYGLESAKVRMQILTSRLKEVGFKLKLVVQNNGTVKCFTIRQAFYLNGREVISKGVLGEANFLPDTESNIGHAGVGNVLNELVLKLEQLAYSALAYLKLILQNVDESSIKENNLSLDRFVLLSKAIFKLGKNRYARVGYILDDGNILYIDTDCHVNIGGQSLGKDLFGEQSTGIEVAVSLVKCSKILSTIAKHYQLNDSVSWIRIEAKEDDDLVEIKVIPTLVLIDILQQVL